MIENLLPVDLPPGLFSNGTKYQSRGRWNTGNLIRFHERTIQPIGGWAQRVTSGVTITGVPHAAICWQLADGTPYTAVGTTDGLFVIDNNDVVYNITPAGGIMHATPYDWQLNTFGAYLMAVNSLRGDDDLSLVNTYVWTGNTATHAAAAWTSAVGPRGAYAAFATPERFLVVLRGKDPTTAPARTGVDGIYSERRVYWASQEELDEFVSTDTNTGGDFDLQTEGRLVVGAAARGQSLIWSDVDLWTMNYIGGELVYSFQNVGRSCGIVSKRGYVLLDKGAYWMGRGKFFIYDGFVRSLPCEVTDAVFGNFNESRAHTVWAFANPRFNEVTWFYPGRGSQYADRYVTFNYAEEHWTYGVLSRTVGVPQRFRQDVVDEPKPVMFTSSGLMFDHEIGSERDSQAYLVSGPVELNVGDQLMRIQGVMPDDLTAGDVALRLYTSMAPDGLESLHGPYTLGTFTNLRLTTRQVRVRLEEASTKSWRIGSLRLAVRGVERRGSSTGAVDTTPASIEVVPTAVTLIGAQHYTFQAIIRNAAGEVLDIAPDQWASDAPGNVSIDSTGTVTALTTPSVAHITASLLSPPLTSNSATVTVIGDNRPVSLELAPVAFDILPTATRQLTWIFRNIAGQIIAGLTPTSFVGTNTLAATVNAAGLVTGVGSGGIQTTITAHYNLVTPVLDSNPVVATAVDPYITHTFVGIANADFVVTSGSGNVRTLLVAGGGGGGAADGSGVACGGGGGGGMLDIASTAVTPGTYHVVIGQGGAGGIGDHTIGAADDHGDTGTNSTALGFTAVGGGGGLTNLATAGGIFNGQSLTGQGGSSGGINTVTDADPAIVTANPYDGIVGPPRQGYKGGAGIRDSTSSGIFQFGGGGGGAGADGSNYTTGAGGAGRTSDISGVTVTYAGGGGGGRGQDGGPGGTGGGGHGGRPTSAGPGSTGTAGTDGLGGGGGGGGGVTFAQGSNGGHGIVIIRYKVSTGIVATGGVKVTHS